MVIDRLFNDGPSPVLERVLEFTESRQNVLAEDVANVSTPGFKQKDLSLEKFQQVLQEKVKQIDQSPPGTVSFDDVASDVENPTRGILFHDGNNRSMEQLMTDEAKNALLHNMIVELLRRQFSTMEMALKDKPV